MVVAKLRNMYYHLRKAGLFLRLNRDCTKIFNTVTSEIRNMLITIMLSFDTDSSSSPFQL